MQDFVTKHNIEQIFMFDGGVDSIIYGDEGLVYGSPLEDSQMVIACVTVATKNNLPIILVTSALGIDDCDVKSYLDHWDQLENGTYGKIKLTSDLPNFNIYEEICRTSDPASIIQESIIAAANGKIGLYKNPRLYPSRISDPSDLPLIRPETQYLWVWDPVKLVAKSPFYQNMMKLLESVGERTPDECWCYWNQWINQFMSHNS